MNIDKQTFNTLDVLYDDKKWGKRIDPDEWNANFKVLEEGHNELATKLNQQVTDIDTAIQSVTSNGGQNIIVQYDGEAKALQDAIDDAVIYLCPCKYPLIPLNIVTKIIALAEILSTYVISSIVFPPFASPIIALAIVGAITNNTIVETIDIANIIFSAIL